MNGQCHEKVFCIIMALTVGMSILEKILTVESLLTTSPYEPI